MALNFAFTADNQNFMNSVNQVKSGIQDAASTIESCGGDIDKVVSNIKQGIALLGVATGLQDFTKQVFNTRAEIQSLSISFETLLGNKDKANALFSELRQFAVSTPMMLKDLAQGAQTMLGFNIEEDKIMPYLKAIGDISMGDAAKFNSLTLAFSQMSAAGKLMGQDLMQMIGQGFNPLAQIAEKTGKTLAEVKAEQEAGKITVQDVQQAFIDATSAGGKYHGMLQKQSEGLAGAYSNLQGAVNDALNSIGESTEGLMATTLSAATAIAKNWELVVLALGTVAGAYGLQKAVDMGSVALSHSAAAAAYEAEAAALAKLIPEKEANSAEDVKGIAVNGKYTTSQAAKIVAMREEVAAHIKVLEAQIAETTQAQISANKKVLAANKELAVAGELVAAEEAKLAACVAHGDAVAIAAAQQNVKTAAELRDTAATAANTAANELNTTTENLNALTKQKSAVSTGLDTAATTGDTVATNFLTIAKERCAAAATKLWGVMAANPVMLVATAVAALGYAIYKVCTYQTDFEKATAKLNGILDENSSKVNREEAELRHLKAALESAEKGSKDWQIIKDEIVSKYGQYFSGLDAEIIRVGNLSTTYDQLTISIRKAAAARAMDAWEKENPLNIDNDLKAIQDLMEGNKVKFMNPGGTTGEGVLHDSTKKLYMSHITDAVLSQDYSKLTKQEQYFLDNNWKFSHGGYYGKNTARSIMYGAGNKTRSYNAGKEKIEERYGVADTPSNPSDTGTNLKTAYNEAEKAYKKAYQEVNEMNRNRAKYTKEQYDAAKDNLKSAKESFEKLGGSTGSSKSGSSKSSPKTNTGPSAEEIAAKQTETNRKILDLMASQAEERLKLDQDYELQRWQNRIDLMEEGEEKILAQQELDNAKELISLEQQKKAAIDAEIARQKALFDAQEEQNAIGKKKYVKKTFNPGDDNLLDNIAKLEELDDAIAEVTEEIETLSSAEVLDNEAIEDAKKKLTELQNKHSDIKIKLGNLDPKEIKKIEEQYANLQSDITASQRKAEQDRLDASRESMNAYLKEFGDYQQKRKAIAEEYDLKIDKAQNDGERMTLMAQKNKALSDLDYSEWVDSGALAMAFGDIKKLSKGTVKQLISDMEQYRGKVVSTFDPDKIAKYEEALRKLRESQSENSFGIFSSFIPDYFKERKQVADRKASAARNVETAMEQGAQLTSRAKELRQQIEIGDLMGEDTSEKKRELIELEAQLGQNRDAITKAKDAFKLLEEEWAQLNTPKEKFEALCGAISNVADFIGGLASEAASMCEALGAEGLGEALGYLGDAMGSVQNIASGFAQGGLVGGIAAAAGEVMGWIGKIFSARDKRHQKNIEELQEQIEALEKSYERLGRAIDDAFSTDASDLIGEQNELLEQQRLLVEQQKDEEEAKKKSDKDKLKEYEERLEEIDNLLDENKRKAKEAIIGEDVKSAINEFASLYAEAWGEGKDAADASMKAVRNIISSALTEMLKKNIQPAATKFYDALAEAMGDGLLTNEELDKLDILKREMDGLAAKGEEQYRKIQERYKTLEELREELTDISFDSVSDNFKSLLSDMESTTADFTDSFTEMLRNALIEGLMTSKYDALLKEWYANFAEKMDDRKLTDAERDELRRQYDEIVQQGLADREAINAIVGGGAYSQEATKGGWAAMGQDTGEELNGRFTAMVELEAINNNLTSEGNMIASQILETLRYFSGLSMVTEKDDSSLRDIRDMMFLSTGHLEDISKYTKQLITIREGIDKLNDLINKRL